MTEHADYQDLRRTAAENYARSFGPVIPAPLAADLIQTAAPAAGEFVVDVACGTGVVTRLAAGRVGAHGRVVGTDLNPAMLDVAAAVPAPPGATIEWRAAEAGALPLADDSFDLVLCQLGLMFFPDRSAAVREMRRVLSPGGRLAINVPGRMPKLFTILVEAVGRHLDPEAAGFLRAVFALGEADLRGLLIDANFHDVTVQSTTKTLALPPPAEFLWQYLQSTPIAGLLPGIDNDRRQELENDVVTRWQDFRAGDGLTVQLCVTTATARK